MVKYSQGGNSLIVCQTKLKIFEMYYTVKVTKSCSDLKTCGMMNYQQQQNVSDYHPHHQWENICLGFSQWQGCLWHFPKFIWFIACLEMSGTGQFMKTLKHYSQPRKEIWKEFCLFTSLARNIFMASQSKIPPAHKSKSQRLCTKDNNILTTLFN